MIHKTAQIGNADIGLGTSVWQHSVILDGAKIGSNCNINCHTFIEGNTEIGDNVTIKSGVYVWSGIRISDNVFVGPNVTFINDKYPRSKDYPDSFISTHVDYSASIGGGAVIMCGVTIGKYAMVGAGAVVTRSVPTRSVVYGNPAIHKGWANTNGTLMHSVGDGIYMDSEGKMWKEIDNQIQEL